MVDALLDTATLIDLLREYEPGAEWFANQEQVFGITKYVWMEVVAGCRNKHDLRKATKLIKRLEIVDTTPEDIDWALEKMIKFNLSHNIDLVDCLIASTAHRLQLPLYTRNLKHFSPLLDDLATSKSKS